MCVVILDLDKYTLGKTNLSCAEENSKVLKVEGRAQIHFSEVNKAGGEGKHRRVQTFVS